MSGYLVGRREAVGDWVISLGQERIGSGVLWPARVLGKTLAKGALSEELRLVSLTRGVHGRTLALMLSLDRLLDLLFVALDISLDGVSLFLELVLLKFQ